MKRRVLCLLLSMLMVLAVVPAMSLASFAAESSQSELGALTADDVAKLNAVLADPTDAENIINNWGFEYDKDATYKKYESLWYDNGHLKALFDLTALNQAGNAVELANNPTEEQIKAAKFVIGDTVAATNNNGTHYFAKAVGGELAGRFFLVGGPARRMQGTSGYDTTESYPTVIKIRDDGLLDAYNPWSEYQGLTAAIYLNYMFTADKLATKFGGVENLGASAGLDTKLFNGYDDMAYTGTYGHFTIDASGLLFDSGSRDGEIGWRQPDIDGDGNADYDYRGRSAYITLMRYGGRTFGSFKINNGGTINGISVGADYNSSNGPRKELGTKSTVSTPNTLQYTVDVKRIDGGEYMVPSLRFVSPNDGSIVKANQGSVVAFQIGEFKSAAVNLNGINPYYIRIYDVALTDTQVLQNHFADLCYYYQLEGTEELRTYGSLALNDTFYQTFASINIGADGAKTLAQTKIDAKLAECRSLSDTRSLINLIKDRYDTVNRSTLAINASAASIADIIREIEEKVQIADGMPAEGDAAAVINEAKAQLGTIKKNVTAYKIQVDAIKTANDAAISRITAFDASIVDASSLETYVGTATTEKLFELLCLLDELADTVSVAATQTYDSGARVLTVSAADANYKSALATEAAASVASIYNYMLSAGAMSSFDVGDYVKFAFMQVRALDYVGMRAVFAVDDAAIAGGYTNGSQSYSVASYGFIMAYAVDDIADITVDYNATTGAVTSTATGATIISASGAKMDDRYAVTDDARAQALAKTGVNGSVYAMKTSMSLAGTSEMTAAYTQKYMYRIFMVLEGEGTTFVSYADVYSRTIASSAISLFDVANASVAQVTDDRYLLPELSISKIIYRATGHLPSKD